MSSISGPILFAPLLKVWVPGGRHPVRYDFTCVAFFPLYQKCRSDVSSCAAASPLSQINFETERLPSFFESSFSYLDHNKHEGAQRQPTTACPILLNFSSLRPQTSPSSIHHISPPGSHDDATDGTGRVENKANSANMPQPQMSNGDQSMVTSGQCVMSRRRFII